MKVEVAVKEVVLQNEDGYTVMGVEVTCSRCDHCVEVFGTSERSIRRGCVMLREECPQGEENFYTDED